MMHNAKQRYDELIENARQNQYDGYVERHHVVPKCLGGTNEKSNIVKLRARDHFVAHQLLVEMYEEQSQEWFKMATALNWFSGKRKDRYDITPDEYELMRSIVQSSIGCRQKRKRKKSTKKRKPTSPETRLKLSVSGKLAQNRPEVKEKQSIASTGRKHSQQTLEKMSAIQKIVQGKPEVKEKHRRAALGKPKSLEHRQAISKCKKGIKLSEEHKAAIGIAQHEVQNRLETKQKKSETMKTMHKLRKFGKKLATFLMLNDVLIVIKCHV
jgi:hypothetical protein